MTLRVSLMVSLDKSVQRLQVFGDSLLVSACMKNEQLIHNVALKPLENLTKKKS